MALIGNQPEVPLERPGPEEPRPGLTRGAGRQQGRGEPAERTGESRRPAVEALVERQGPGVAPVAGKVLVAAVPGERHGDMLAGDLGDVVGRNGRGVGKWLVEVPGELGQDVERIGLDHQLVMVGAVAGCDLAGKAELVEVGLVEADGEGADRRGRGLSHEGDDSARVHAAAQEGADGHVADHVALHGIRQLSPEPLDPLLLRRAVVGILAKHPVAGDHGLAAVKRLHQNGGRRQLPDRLEDGAWRRHIVIRQVIAQRVPVELARHARVLQDALDLGGEEQPLSVPGIDERLDAGAVAGEDEAARPTVQDCEGEHAAQAAHAAGPVHLVGPQDDLGVGRRGKAGTARFQLAAQLAKVVDLPVEHDQDRAIVAGHGLIPGCQVDDGQPPVSEPGASSADETLAVRAAVGLDRGHGAQERLVHGATRDIEDSGDSAHG